MKSFDIIRARIVSHSVGSAFSCYDHGSRKLILRHRPKVLHLFDLDGDQLPIFKTLWALPSDASSLAVGQLPGDSEPTSFISTTNGGIFMVASPFNSPRGLSTNSSSKKRKNIGDDSTQPQKKHKSESTQSSRGKQNAADKENIKSQSCNIDSSFKLTEFQLTSKVILPSSKGLIVAYNTTVELCSTYGAQNTQLAQQTANISSLKLLSAEKDHTDAILISKPLYSALFGADPTLMKRSVLLIGNDVGDLFYRSFSEHEADSKLLVNTKSSVIGIFAVPWASSAIKENNTLIVVSRSGYMNIFAYRSDRLITKACQIEGPITFCWLDQDNIIFGSNSALFFIPLTPDPQRPGEEIWDVIDRTIPIRLPIPSDVYNVFLLDKSKQRYGATSVSGYFYAFTIPKSLNDAHVLQGDMSQSEIRVKTALDQMAVISTRQTALRQDEEDVNNQLTSINKSIHVIQEIKSSGKLIQCKIYPCVTESNGRISVQIRTELRYSGKFESYFSRNWFYLLQVSGPSFASSVQSFQIPLAFNGGIMSYDQPLFISSHGVLKITPSLGYHSVLGATDKLFVLPLLKDGSLSLDTVVGASIVQPSDENWAIRTEVKLVKTNPALWQSIHSIIHARSQPFQSVPHQSRSIIPTTLSLKIGLPFCDDFVTCAKPGQNTNPLASSQSNETLALNSLFSTSKRFLTSLLLIDCFNDDQRSKIKDAMKEQAESSFVTALGNTCHFKAASFLHQFASETRSRNGQNEASQARVYEITAQTTDDASLRATLRAALLMRFLSCLKFFEPKWLVLLEERLSTVEDSESGRRAVNDLTRVIGVMLQQCSSVNKHYDELKSRLLDCREHCDELHRLQRAAHKQVVVSNAKGPRAAVLLQRLLGACMDLYQQTRDVVQQSLIL
jgi:hypothetical protein